MDINQYPNAMSAPRDIQARVASVIPFNRFGPRTQTLMRVAVRPARYQLRRSALSPARRR